MRVGIISTIAVAAAILVPGSAALAQEAPAGDTGGEVESAEEIEATEIAEESPAPAAVAAEPAPKPEPAPAAAMTQTSSGGLTTRDIVGYSALGTGGVLAILGIVQLATVNDASAAVDPDSGVVTVTEADSKAPGSILITAGAGLALSGALLLWLEPMFFDEDSRPSASGVSMGIGPNGFVLGGSF